jgi:hypothetical protein
MEASARAADSRVALSETKRVAMSTWPSTMGAPPLREAGEGVVAAVAVIAGISNIWNIEETLEEKMEGQRWTTNL